MAETIGSIIQQEPKSVEEFKRQQLFENVLEQTKNKVDETTAKNIKVVKLEPKVGGDFHRRTKVIRLSEDIQDVKTAVHVIIHENAHKDFEKKSNGTALIDNDINEALTETLAGKISQQGAQTYKQERNKLQRLQAKTNVNLLEAFKKGNAQKINQVILAHGIPQKQAA